MVELWEALPAWRKVKTKKAAKLRDESCGTMLFMLVKGNNIKVFPTLKLPKRYQYEGMEREITTQNLVFALFSHVEMIRCETLVACFTLADTIQNLLENHEVFKINVFSHCFPRKRKSTYRKSVSAWLLKWTSLGLNQGPPDYESVALTNWATSPT